MKNNLQTFFSQEYSKLKNFVLRYFDDRYTEKSAEDIVQDVALNLFTIANLDVHVENIAAYVYRAIRNKIIDIQRKSKKTISIERFNNDNNENVFEDTYKADNDDENFDIEIFHEYLYEALDELKPNFKAIIIETEINGKSFKELSEEWNIPVGTLLSWKHRAMNKLQNILTKNNV